MDIRTLFKTQIEEEKCSMLYFVLKEGQRECLQRYEHDDADLAVAVLKDFKYLDTRLGIPRFERKAKRNAAKTA
jgi:hypothetical protein